MTTDVAVAEKIRQLTSTNAMFANFMADSSFDSAEEMLRFVEWFEEIGRVPSGWDVTRYCRAQMAIAYVEQAAQLAEANAKLAAAEKEREHYRSFAFELLNDECEWQSLTVEQQNERRAKEKADAAQLAAFNDPTPISEAWCREHGGEVFKDISCIWTLPKGITVIVYLYTGLVIIEEGNNASTALWGATCSQLLHLLTALGATR